MHHIRFSLLGCLLLLLGACATGPEYSTVVSTLPSLQAEQGRIYFYRSGSPFGAAIQPEVLLNGETVGDAVPGGIYFKDVPPGNYEVSTATEVDRKASFTLDAGQTRYIRLVIGLGLFVGRVYPELVDPTEAKEEIRGLSYTGEL